jgi:hypothetical protein
MKRVGNADTISDIEFVIDAPPAGDPRQTWTACGAECTRSRHRYSGPGYEFFIEVIDIRRPTSERTSWHVMIVSESWKAAGASGEIRSTKWLKVLGGKASDIKSWMREHRSRKVMQTCSTQNPEL